MKLFRKRVGPSARELRRRLDAIPQCKSCGAVLVPGHEKDRGYHRGSCRLYGDAPR